MSNIINYKSQFFSETNNKEYRKGYNNRYIIYTLHSVERYIERYSSNITEEILFSVIKNVMKNIIEKYNDQGGVYGYHSKSTGIGGIVDWRLDYKGKNKENNAVLVSLFPVKKFHSFRNVDAQFIVEKHLILWAKEKGFSGKRKKNLCESYFDDQHITGYNIYISFFEGKLYDLPIDKYMVLE